MKTPRFFTLIAAGHFLCDDGDTSVEQMYDTLVDCVEKEKAVPDKVIIWEPFEWNLPETVLDYINTLADSMWEAHKDFTKLLEEYRICSKCNGVMEEGKLLANYHNIQHPEDGSPAEFENKMEDCMKCTDCGHSYVLKTKEK